jgi:U3 small nucleolar RNA-associated protein 22
MSVLTNGHAGRATRRRRLSASLSHGGPSQPVDNGSDSESDASDVSSSGEKDEASVPARKSNVSHPKQANGNRPSILPNGGLNRTSMLALQVNELLSETRPNYEKLESRLAPTIQRITKLIQQIPARPPALLKDAEKTLKADSGVRIPFIHSRPAKDSKYEFAYQTPESIDYLGSVGLQLVADSSAHIFTIAVQMPTVLLQEKDYLNNRAFYKRAFYLACIAAALKNAGDGEFEILFQAKDDLALIPILIIRATGKSLEGFQQSKVELQITVTFPPKSVPIEKIHPGKNCLREGGNTIATPMYNSCIRSLASLTTTQAVILDSKKNCMSFGDTSRIASIWLRQRGLGSSVSQGGFGSEEWSLLCAILLQTGGHNGQPLLSSRYTTVQLFKVVLQFLAVKDLTSPMVIRSTVQLPQTDTPVLYDGATGVNLFFKMTPWSYQALRDEASATLAAANARNEDNFDSIFIIRSAEPLYKFDELYQIEVPGGITTRKAYATLAQGLGDRVERTSIDVPSDALWKINEVKRLQTSINLTIGLVLVPENKDRLVDHGPSAEEQEEAATFRAFWGEKAELRRFKDGSIVESLVWSEDEPATSQIIKYLAEKHLDVQASSVISLTNQADSLMLDQDSKLKPADAFKLLRNAYQTLTTQLHSLEEMPLRIRSITPADGRLSSSSLVTPLSSIESAPADIYIEFENSTRWPDHLPAIQHTKIAFLLKLGEVLQAAHTEYSTRVGLENADTASSGHANTSFLDIILPTSGPGLPPVSFRLRITHDRELTLIEKELASRSLSQPAQITMSHALQMQKRSLATQRHTTMLNTLTTRFPALSSTIRLLKKWTASHMLPASVIPEPLLDLLCIHTFTSPYPWSIPSSAQTAFLRTLHTISRWDWASEPLLVDTSLDGSFFSTASDVENVRTRFTAWRKLDLNMNNVILFVGSNLDTTGVVWTQGQQPPRVVAGRLTALARACVAVVREKGLHMREGNWKGLFQSSLLDFDFLIHLKRGFGRREERKSAGKFKNLQLQEEMDTDAVGFDAVELFVKDLEGTFEHSILFFYDRDGGKVIAGLWNPRVMKQQDFRVRLGVSSMPITPAKVGADDEKDKVVVNQAGILAEIAIMAEGIVQKIEVLKDFV